jgi:hypothetical protein
MGRQVNFFFLPQDLVECEERIRKLGPVNFFEAHSDSPVPKLLANTEWVEMGKTIFKIYLCRPEDLPLVKLSEIKEQGWFVVEGFISPVIELNRCYFNGQMLRRGRLYYNESYYAGDGELISKPNDFIIWARKVLRAAVRGLSKSPNVTAYAGKDAILWKEKENGSFVTL